MGTAEIDLMGVADVVIILLYSYVLYFIGGICQNVMIPQRIEQIEKKQPA